MHIKLTDKLYIYLKNPVPPNLASLDWKFRLICVIWPKDLVIDDVEGTSIVDNITTHS